MHLLLYFHLQCKNKQTDESVDIFRISQMTVYEITLPSKKTSLDKHPAKAGYRIFKITALKVLVDFPLRMSFGRARKLTPGRIIGKKCWIGYSHSFGKNDKYTYFEDRHLRTDTTVNFLTNHASLPRFWNEVTYLEWCLPHQNRSCLERIFPDLFY